MSRATMPDIRLLLTNDLFGAFFPQPVSWGKLPGGHALTRTVDRLREGARTSAWIDGGDFSGGGPLAPASDGTLGWAAAATLGIDAAVPGNHEFDYGDDVMAAESELLPFPLLAADLREMPESAGAAAARVRDHFVVSAAGGRSVAVVGLCLPERRGQLVYDTPSDLQAAASRARKLADTLRPDVDHVVVVMHEGIGIYPGLPLPGPTVRTVQALEPVRDFCLAVAGSVDAVVGGHTLGRWVGDLGGIPFVQPWALGVEIGILDFGADGVTAGAQPVPTAWSRTWTGPGAALDAELRQQVVGALDEPLATPSLNGAPSLAQAVAEGLLGLVAADVVLVQPIDVGCSQVPLDGRMGFLAAGPVTEADILRILPWAAPAGDEVHVGELTPSEVDILATGFAVPGVPIGLARRSGAAGGTVAVAGNYVARASRLLERAVEWTPTGAGQRAGLRAFLAR